MSSARDGKVKGIAVRVLEFGYAFVAFFYLADFTLKQSFFLAILGVIAVDGYRLASKVAEKQEPQFEPFWMRIEPNWYELARDFGLTDVSEWEEFLKNRRFPSGGYSVLRDGMSFTMLSPTVFYSNDHQTFFGFGELDLRASIREMEGEKPDNPMLWIEPPTFYVTRLWRSWAEDKRNGLVFEFGLILQHSSTERDYLDNPKKVPIAYLPEVVFHDYYNSGDEYDLELSRKNREEAKIDLTAFSWNQKERDYMGRGSAFTLEHKYLTVSYRGITGT